MRGKKLLLYVPAMVLAVVTIYPLLWVLCATVSRRPQMGRISIIPQGITFNRIITLFTQFNFLIYFKNTILFAVSATAISLFFNSMAAYAFARLSFPGKDRIFSVYLGTMMVPFSIIMMPLYMMMRTLRLTDTLWALILPGMAGAYGVFMLRQFYLGIPKELEEAGRIDGLSYWGIYTRIIIPLSKPIMLTLGIFSFKGHWNSYLWPTIAISDKTKYLISQGLASFTLDLSGAGIEVDWNYTLAGSLVSMIPIIIIFIFFQKQLVEGVKLSGMKG